MNEEIKEILLIIKSCKQDYDKQKNGMHTFDYGELYLLYDYITNLQQAVEVKNERIKEEQQEKERYIKFYNELNIWNKELQQENEYLKKNNPEQNIEHFRIIKENKRKINNLREENKTLQENNQAMQEEMARVWEENERLKEEKDNLYLDNTMLKAEKDIYKQGYEDFKNLLNTLKNGSDKQ